MKGAFSRHRGQTNARSVCLLGAGASLWTMSWDKGSPSGKPSLFLGSLNDESGEDWKLPHQGLSATTEGPCTPLPKETTPMPLMTEFKNYLTPFTLL